MELSKDASDMERLFALVVEGQNKLVEGQNKLLEVMTYQTHVLEKVADKISNVEMRQCATSGEGTDASRMTSHYFRGNSALWAKHIKSMIVEMVVSENSIKAMQYKGIFNKKDKRRGELLTAVFYQTAIKKSSHVYDAVKDSGRHNGSAQMALIGGGF